MSTAGDIDKMLVQAFQRIEKRVADEKLRSEREEQKREQLELRMRELKRKKIIEYVTLSATIAFSFFIIFIVWYTDGGLLRTAASTFQTAAGEGSGNIDCTRRENHNHYVCVEKRLMKADSNWQGISLYRNGKEHPFTFHDQKDEPASKAR